MIWVGKNLPEQGVICCINNARDVGMVKLTITNCYFTLVSGSFNFCTKIIHDILVDIMIGYTLFIKYAFET